MKKVQQIILAGGNGSRLWPFSGDVNYPKQFLKFSNKLSPLQNTLLRNRFLGKPIVVINERHELIAEQQIKEIGLDATLIIEPIAKNTAACSLFAVKLSASLGYDKTLLFPADHHVCGELNYKNSILKAISSNASVSLIGIKPSEPEIGYGYIKIGSPCDNDLYEVEAFKEKPDLDTAKAYFDSGSYYWNSGIFALENVNFLKQAKKLRPKMFASLSEAFEVSRSEEGKIRIEARYYEPIESLSLDKGIIEKDIDKKMVKASFSWRDLGSWNSLWQISKKDEKNNFLPDGVVVDAVTGSYVLSTEEKTTAVIGLENVVVVNTPQGLLVADRFYLSEMQKLYDSLGKKGLLSKK